MFKSCFLVIGLSIATVALGNLEDKVWIYHGKHQDISLNKQGDRRGTPLICIDEIAKKFPVKIKYQPEDFSVTFRKQKNFVRIWTHSNRILGQVYSDGKAIPFESRLSVKPAFLGAKLCLPIEFGDRIIRPLLESFPPDSLPNFEESNPGSVDVVLDPGHGGNDFGAHRKISKAQHFLEKEFSLQLAKEIRRGLQDLGIKARLTREGDHFLTLPERAEIANKSGAKFLLSLHMNSSPTASVRGYEIYILSLDQADAQGRNAVARENQFIPADLPSWLEKAIADLRAEANLESSLKWARAIDLALKPHIRSSQKQGIKMGPFYILYGAAMPAVLLEIGYLTNPEDRKLLLDPRRRSALAKQISISIANQLKVTSVSQ